MLGESLIEEGKVGVDQEIRREVFANEMRDIQLGFERKVVMQQVIELGIELE